jgi:hypothetical protein
VATLYKELERVGKGQAPAGANEKHAESVELRSQVYELEKELAATKKLKQQIVDAIKPADLRRLEALVKKIDKLILRITGTNADLELYLSGLRVEATKLQEVANRVTQLRGKKAAAAIVGEVLALVPDAPPDKSWPKRDPLHRAYTTPTTPTKPAKAMKGAPVKATRPTSRSETNGHAVESSDDLKPVHLRFLSAISWWESVGVTTPDLGGVAFVARTSTKSSAFINNRSRLRSAGYIDYPSSGRVSLTDAGRAVTPPPSRPPTNEALHEAVFQQLTPVLGRLLRPLIEAYPDSLALKDLAEQAGTSTTSSAFINNRSWLRARGLADYPHAGFVRATELLFPETAS